jgi:hypothetical protein
MNFWFVFGKRASQFNYFINNTIIENGKMSLPFNPGEITVPRAKNNRTTEVVGMNEEITIPGVSQSQTIVIDSILWNARQQHNPRLYLQLFEQLMESNEVFRFFIDRNSLLFGEFVIDSLSYTQRAREEHDYYYTLTLRRHPSYGARRVQAITPPNIGEAPEEKTEIAPTPPARSAYHAGLNWDFYTVVRGDWLIRITQRYINAGARGSTYRELFNENLNLISNPNLIRTGWRLAIPQVWRERAGVG